MSLSENRAEDAPKTDTQIETTIETTLTNLPVFMVGRNGRITAPIITDASTFINFTVHSFRRIRTPCLEGKCGRQGVCVDCPAGTYGTKTGVNLCTLCPTGKYLEDSAQ